MSYHRMTQHSKWTNAAKKYFAYKEEIKLKNVLLPTSGAKVIFYIQMPKSWTKKKKIEMDQQPHLQKPDLSNLIKALEDAVYTQDSVIWNYAGLTKRWAYEGSIEII